MVLKVGDKEGLSASKTLNTLKVPDGYKIVSATCNSSTKNYSTSGQQLVDIEGGFQVGMAGSQNNPTLQIYAGTATAGASASVTVTYTLESTTNPSDTKTVSVSFTLYASK